MTLEPRVPVVKLFLSPQNAFKPPLDPTLHSFQEDVLIDAGAEDEEAPRIATGGCERWGLVDAARLLASIWLVMGPSFGRILFP